MFMRLLVGLVLQANLCIQMYTHSDDNNKLKKTTKDAKGAAKQVKHFELQRASRVEPDQVKRQPGEMK